MDDLGALSGRERHRQSGTGRTRTDGLAVPDGRRPARTRRRGDHELLRAPVSDLGPDLVRGAARLPHGHVHEQAVHLRGEHLGLIGPLGPPARRPGGIDHGHQHARRTADVVAHPHGLGLGRGAHRAGIGQLQEAVPPDRGLGEQQRPVTVGRDQQRTRKLLHGRSRQLDLHGEGRLDRLQRRHDQPPAGHVPPGDRTLDGDDFETGRQRDLQLRQPALGHARLDPAMDLKPRAREHGGGRRGGARSAAGAARARAGCAGRAG